MSKRALGSPVRDVAGWARIAGLTAAFVASGCGDDVSQGDDGDDESGAPEESGTDDAGTDGDESGDTTGGEPPLSEPAAAGMRLLLADQYVKTVATLLGPEAAAVADPPLDSPIDGFDAIGAREIPLSPQAVERYEDSAIAIGEAVAEHPETLAQIVPCVTEGPQDITCYTAIAQEFGRVAWRRPLTNPEATRIIGIAQSAREWGDGDFAVGVQYAIAMILQSPDFLYAVELGVETEEGSRELTSDELATRLALFVLGRAPDAALFARADAGDLEGDGLRDVATDLLDEADARTAVTRFYDELLRIRELPLKTKDPELFPEYTPDLGASMRQETLMLVADVVFEGEGNLLRLFDADYTFVDANLAAFYGVAAPDGGTFARVDLPGGQRRLGLLTQPSLLATFGHPDRNSPTRRGLFVNHTILCNEIPPPPGDVDTTIPQQTEPTTLRDLMEQHMEKGTTCNACHSQMDPIGFAFEYYDSTGAYREEDNGHPVDASGTVEGIGSWSDATELAVLVRDDARMPLCLTRNLYRHALGHADGEGQAEALAYIADAFVAADHSFKQLVVELAANPSFRRVGDPQ